MTKPIAYRVAMEGPRMTSLDLSDLERKARAAKQWSTGVWFAFDNPKGFV